MGMDPDLTGKGGNLSTIHPGCCFAVRPRTRCWGNRLRLPTAKGCCQSLSSGTMSSNSPLHSGPIFNILGHNLFFSICFSSRYVHGAGLACRTLDPSKILVLGKNRLLVNCGGIFDVLTYDPNSSNPLAAMAVYQQEDLVSLGRIVLALSCNSFIAIQRENLAQSMELVTGNYSSDLRNLIMYLLTAPQRVKSVNDLMPMIGDCLFLTPFEATVLRCHSLN